MSRLVTIAVDIDDLPAMISHSVETALRVHGVELDPAHLREVGRNSACVVVLSGEVANLKIAAEREERVRTLGALFAEVQP